MLDRYRSGKSYRNSPEAPVPVIDKPVSSDYLGGAANVVNNLHGLGAKVTVIGIVGDDADGKILSSKLSSLDNVESKLCIISDRITTVKERIMAGKSQLARLDYEDTTELEQEFKERLKKQIKQTCADTNFDAIIVQDYDKGVMNADLAEYVVKVSEDFNLPLYIDPREKNFFYYKKCRLFKPNKRELEVAFERNIELSIENLNSCAVKLREYVSYDTFVVTLSEKGAYFRDLDKSGLIPTVHIDNADVSGAGDTFISVICLADLAGFTIEKSIHISNIASYIVCNKEGVQPITIRELRKML